MSDPSNHYKKNNGYKNLNASSYINISNSENVTPVLEASVVTKNIQINVSNDFDSEWFLEKATPKQRTNIIELGEEVYNRCKMNMSDELDSNIDNIIETEINKIVKKHKRDISKLNAQIIKLESTKDHLEKQLDYQETQVNLLNNSLIKKNKTLYDETEDYRESIKAEYDNKYEILRQEMLEYKNKIEEIRNINQKREDAIRDDYDNRIRVIQEKYEEINNIYRSSSKKGGAGESHVSNVLNELFPTSTSITDTHKETAKGDFHIMYDGVGILFENKNYDSRPVPKRDIKKFIRDVEINGDCSCGIMASQKTGISNRKDFSIEFTTNNKPMIYLHHTLKNRDNIKYAADLLVSMVKSNSVFDKSKLSMIHKIIDTCATLKKNNNLCEKSITPLIESFNENKTLIKKLEKDLKQLLSNNVIVNVQETEETQEKQETEEKQETQEKQKLDNNKNGKKINPKRKKKKVVKKKENKPKTNKSKTNKSKNDESKANETEFVAWMASHRDAIKDYLAFHMDEVSPIDVVKEARKRWDNLKN